MNSGFGVAWDSSCRIDGNHFVWDWISVKFIYGDEYGVAERNCFPVVWRSAGVGAVVERDDKK